MTTINPKSATCPLLMVLAVITNYESSPIFPISRDRTVNPSIWNQQNIMGFLKVQYRFHT
jgi:hypothetical protein